jgi:LysR family transcriptional regulator, glycine cleavage system transcriptional activator
MRDLPLTAVRSFCAAAEQLSFKAAAEQLFVTPGAISQQVKQLEDWFGLQLFERKVRGVTLTPSGKVFYVASEKALRQLASAAQALRPEEKSVRLTTVPSFATRWLVPRLSEFSKIYPAIDVSIDASDDTIDLNSGAADLAVRISRSIPQNLHSEKLFDEVWWPVCSPAYKKQHVKAGVIQASARLLHETHSLRSTTLWENWLEKHGAASGVMPRKGAYFSLEMLAYQAAVQGQGIALANKVLVQQEFLQKSLVVAVNKPLYLGQAYYLAWSLQPGRVNNPKGSVQSVAKWISKLLRETA